MDLLDYMDLMMGCYKGFIYGSLKKLAVGLRFKFWIMSGEPDNVRQDQTKSDRGSLWIGEVVSSGAGQCPAEAF
jgi:hypothetical protein